MLLLRRFLKNNNNIFTIYLQQLIKETSYWKIESLALNLFFWYVSFLILNLRDFKVKSKQHLTVEMFDIKSKGFSITNFNRLFIQYLFD